MVFPGRHLIYSHKNHKLKRLKILLILSKLIANTMKHYLKYISMFFLSFLLYPLYPEESASKGILSHTDSWIELDGSISLKGEWEFYWQEYLTGTEKGSDPSFQRVPGNWAAGDKFPASGYASYRLVLRDLIPGKIYSLYIPEMISAFKVFLDDREIASNGVPGTDRTEELPCFSPVISTFTAGDTTSVLTVWVSNYHYRKSGIWRNLKLGTPGIIQKIRMNRMFLEIFLFGVLLFVCIYHISIYLFRREEKAQLYFGLICLVIALRIISTGEQFLTYALPAIPWEIVRRVEFLPFAFTPVLMPLYLKTLFPSETSRKSVRIFLCIGALTVFVFLFLPVRFSNNFIIFAELLLVAILLYSLLIIYKAVQNQRIGAYMILSAMVILLLTALNDVLYSNLVIHTFYMTQIGFILFILMQVLMLTRRYAFSFTTIEKLTHNLKDFNQSLSRFVPFQFLEYLNKGSILEVFLGDQVQKNMTILFADIRSFTTLSENMTPEENFRFLNSFLSNVVPVIREENGFVDKFMGDGIMALFPEKPDHALKAAISLQRAVHEYNSNRDKAGYRKIRLGIGLHSGGIMLGTIGEHDRMETTVISDTVNIASRMEEMTKIFGAGIIISKQMYQSLEAPEEFECRYLGPVEIKGKKDQIEILEVLNGLPGENEKLKLDSMGIFASSVTQYLEGHYAKALLGFHKVLNKNPDDKGAKYFINKCAGKT